MDRFLEKVEPEPMSGCWLWLGARQPFGYGVLNISRRGRVETAHRLAWGLFRGTIPDAMHVLHRCDNPPCCNPAHLFLGGPRDNRADMVAKGRDRGRGKKKLTPEMVGAIRARAAAGGVTQTQLSEEYGITRRHVYGVIHREMWAHI